MIERKRQDPLRRFAPTPLEADLQVMGRTIRLATNSRLVLDQAVQFLARYAATPQGAPEFLWRIVSQARAGVAPPWPEISAFSEDGLRLISIGQHSFLGVDLKRREAVGILAEALVSDAGGFCTPFLDDLFLLTAGSLRLVPIAAACVAQGERGLLIFGPPNSGKTTSSYLAAKLGLEFHADQAVFLERQAGRLLAWGDFLPAVFRPEALRYIPELSTLTSPFHYRQLTFHYLDKNYLQPKRAHPVLPVGCVFLARRQAQAPFLEPLSGDGFSCRLADSQLFKDDERFEDQRATVLDALGKLPAYRLAYGSDPNEVAPLLRNILIHEVSLGSQE